MSSFQPTQAEIIILESDVEQVELKLGSNVKALIVQVRDKNGIDKNVKLIGDTILPNGKVLLKEGDIITYIAIM